MEQIDTNRIFNAINSINNNINLRPVLYRQLSYGEERYMYNQLVDAENQTVIFYDERHFYRYYFTKFNDRVYHIVTNGDFTSIYTIREIRDS